MPIDDKDEEDIFLSYPFGIYKCTCGTLYIWYPDSKNDPKQNFFPASISCSCGSRAKIREKLRIKFDEIDEKLVPLFISITEKYEFTRLLIIDQEHVHLVWNTKKAS